MRTANDVKENYPQANDPIEIIRNTDLKKWITHKMNETRPTDEMIFKHSMMDKLETYWEDGYVEGGKKWIPADIIWANTIPIKDCRFCIPMDENEEHPEDTVLNEWVRIVVFEDFMDTIKNDEDSDDDDDMYHIIGVVSMKFPDGVEVVMPFGVTKGDDRMFIDRALMIKTKNKKYEFRFEHKDADGMFTGGLEEVWYIMTQHISAWYGMQLALLHPQVKEVFNHPKDVPVNPHTDKNKNQNNKKTKIKYIKRHVINVDEIDEAMKRSHTIYKKCWYVTGHWRNQKTKNGHKRIFIQGFWKGVLRDLKKGDVREREVIINEENLHEDKE